MIKIFLFISNNQTLLDIHDYQGNICAKFHLKHWVEEIQYTRTIHFCSEIIDPLFTIFDDDHKLCKILFIAVEFWKNKIHFSKVLSLLVILFTCKIQRFD